MAANRPILAEILQCIIPNKWAEGHAEGKQEKQEKQEEENMQVSVVLGKNDIIIHYYPI